MSFLSALFNGGDTVKQVGDTVDKLFTSDEERLEKKIEMLNSSRKFDLQELKLIAEQNVAQTEVNKAEAVSSSIFVAGWRPAIGWVGAFSLFYQFIVFPLLLWLPVSPPPPIDTSQLYPIIMGMLGIAGMRSYDKAKGTDTKKVG